MLSEFGLEPELELHQIIAVVPQLLDGYSIAVKSLANHILIEVSSFELPQFGLVERYLESIEVNRPLLLVL